MKLEQKQRQFSKSAIKDDNIQDLQALLVGDILQML